MTGTKKFISFLFIIVILFSGCIYSQGLTGERADEFIKAVIGGDINLDKFILPEELAISNRLGITFENVEHKYLVGYDIDKNIKSGILNNNLKYNLEIKDLTDNYSCLEFTIPEKNYFKKFYFYNGYFVSPVKYFARNWMRFESNYFIYLVSDPASFNSYALDNMEKFLLKEGELLNIDKEKLSRNKIYYILCRDQDEIEKITGYKSLGMYDLAFDYVISTFICHYHELSHMLMNFKLQKISLYTNPFLQEGFAVAMGGRGGREPHVILDIGYYLLKSGFADYKELLNRKNFFAEDASIGYAVSGLYNKFLIEKNGIDNYISLYKKYSFDESQINESALSPDDLPGINEWNNYINNEYKLNGIVPYTKNVPTVYKKDLLLTMSVEGSDYIIGLKDTVLLSVKNPPENYTSSRFKEIFPGKKYSGEKYLLTANSKEILLYNLYTNNLMADYISSFSIPPAKIKPKDGFLYFKLPKKFFDEDISDLVK